MTIPWRPVGRILAPIAFVDHVPFPRKAFGDRLLLVPVHSPTGRALKMGGWSWRFGTHSMYAQYRRARVVRVRRCGWIDDLAPSVGLRTQLFGGSLPVEQSLGAERVAWFDLHFMCTTRTPTT